MSEDKEVSFQELIGGDRPVLIDFFATWCGPCMGMNPILKDLAKEVKDKAHIVKIDIDKNLKLATDLKVMGVPTFMLYKNGEIQWREAGTKTLEQLKEIIKLHAQ